jgi:bisanhydrobacterioruberin hydratase
VAVFDIGVVYHERLVFTIHKRFVVNCSCFEGLRKGFEKPSVNGIIVVMDQLLSTAAPLAAALAIIAFAVPSYIGLVRQKGPVKALLAVVIISVVLLAIQAAAIQFTYPFGDFSFGGALGYKLLGMVPWTIAFAYTPLVLAIFWLASKLTKSGFRVVLSGLFLAAANAVLDPALAFMGLRSWENGGPFYGVPVLNFAGWFISGVIAALILHALWGKEDPVRRSIAFSGFAIIWFWGGVNLGLKQWIPAGVGLGIGLLLLILMIIEKRRQAKEKD